MQKTIHINQLVISSGVERTFKTDGPNPVISSGVERSFKTDRPNPVISSEVERSFKTDGHNPVISSGVERVFKTDGPNPVISSGVERSHFQIFKSAHFQILLFFLLCSFLSTAQNYQWKWALSGGGFHGDTGSGPSDEQIYDIKVGTDGNYYFIANLTGTLGTQLAGVPVTTNNIPAGGNGTNDIFLFSTTCDGTVRWKQVLGGGSSDRAYNLVLDSLNNVYIGGYFNMGITNSAGSFPVRFSPTDSLPASGNSNIASDYWKTLFLVKYDSNGVYRGKKALQGDVSGGITNPTFSMILTDLAIDSQNKLHFIVGLLNGTHLDSQVTVPAQYKYNPNNWTYNYQYHLVQYDTDLDYVNSKVLPFGDWSQLLPGVMRFVYDENNDTYYLAGRRGTIVGGVHPLSYAGGAFVERSFILAINGADGSEKWRREIQSPDMNGTLAGGEIASVAVDPVTSDVYIGGVVSTHATTPSIKIYDPTDANVLPYLYTPATFRTPPILAKLNSDGVVQWIQSMSDQNTLAPGQRYGKGIAINTNEVAFGVQAGAEFWDAIEIVRPVTNHQPDPVLIRFNKQNGAVLGIHDIEGAAMGFKKMGAVALDQDNNYITGGNFSANLFMNNTWGITPLITAGQSDFFVAKLEANPCGSGPGSTEKFNKLNVKVYPNPTMDILNIETTETLSSYIVYDMLGRRVQHGLFNSQNQINLHNVSSGTYFIQVHTVQGSTATVKVVKK